MNDADTVNALMALAASESSQAVLRAAVVSALSEARRLQRERCALVAQHHFQPHYICDGINTDIAAAIRSLPDMEG